MHDFVEFSTSIRGLIKWVTPLGRVFKIGKRLCKILSVFVVDKGMIKWVTPLGVR